MSEEFDRFLNKWKDNEDFSSITQVERYNAYTSHPWDEIDYSKVIVRNPDDLSVLSEYLVITIEKLEDLHHLEAHIVGRRVEGVSLLPESYSECFNALTLM